jgi:hypothetical protein
MPVNASEALVAGLCQRSFLEPWAYMNPCSRQGKELADAVVVFGSIVILFSVKYSRVDPSLELSQSRNRWEKRAVAKSVKQLFGARRHIARSEEFLVPGDKRTVVLPAADQRRIYLVSISLGGNHLGRFGSLQLKDGFVHVLDDLACIAHFVELDTITDFVEYLAWREALPMPSEPSPTIGEEDYLAAYVLNGKDSSVLLALPKPGDFFRYIEGPAYSERRQADPAGYFWDALILHIWSQLPRFLSHGAKIGSEIVPSPTADAMERVLREMATHTRAERRFLGAATYMLFKEHPESRARVLRSFRGPGYVLMRRESVKSVQKLQEELFGRCAYVQEILMPDRDVLGLASMPELVTLESNVPIILAFLQGSVGGDQFVSQVRDLAKGANWFQELGLYDVDAKYFGLEDGEPHR